jgi:hypothetical protein
MRETRDGKRETGNELKAVTVGMVIARRAASRGCPPLTRIPHPASLIPLSSGAALAPIRWKCPNRVKAVSPRRTTATRDGEENA